MPGTRFAETIAAWRAAVGGLAAEILEAAAAARGAPAAAFSRGGAYDVARGGERFHVKETHRPPDAASDTVLLPPHRDPSLLSLVVHFSPAPTGLEVRVDGEWRSLPRAGPDVVTVLAGSVLSKVLPGCAAPRHRVVAAFGAEPRVAATFFFEPRANAVVGDVCAATPGPTFEAWKAKAYAKYLKAKKEDGTS